MAARHDSSEDLEVAQLPQRSTRFSEGEAVAALRRAAALQHEAAGAAEQRSAQVTSLAEIEHRTYDAADLIAAAEEAGIAPEFARVALVDVGRSAGGQALETREGAASRWLGTKRRLLIVSRVYEDTPERIWGALLEEAESTNFRLQLDGVTGSSPTEGGITTFRMGRLLEMMSSGGGYSQLALGMEQVESWELHAWMRPVGQRTELNLYMDLRKGTARNVRWARGLTLGFSGLAAFLAFGFALAMGPVLAGLAAVGGAASGGGAGIWGYRALYRRAVRRVERELERLLAAVDNRTRLEAYRVIGKLPEPK